MNLFTAAVIERGKEIIIVVSGENADEALLGLERKFGAGKVTILEAVPEELASRD